MFDFYKTPLSLIFVKPPFPWHMDEILGELRELRGIVLSLQSEYVHCQPRIPICLGVTGKGTVCRNRAVLGGEYCRMHGVCREVRPGSDVKVPKKVKKPKKIQPEHNHQIDEIGVGGCPLCDTHGDVWDPKLPECNFEGNEVTFESC